MVFGSVKGGDVSERNERVKRRGRIVWPRVGTALNDSNAASGQQADGECPLSLRGGLEKVIASGKIPRIERGAMREAWSRRRPCSA